MPPVNVLIKPASSACNMTCAYCFYRDVASHRQEGFQGMLSPRLMEEVVAGAMEFAEHSCSFLFQGGEPTLAGLDFYRQVVELVKKHEKPGVKVSYAIQTNAFRLDEEWCAFFKEHDFLVGVSLDGPAELHNLNRTDPAQNGTFNDVMRSVALLKKHGVTFNILCVLTGKNARSIERIYRFFRKQGLDHIQFIPCLEPLGQERGWERYHLSVEEYGEFLIRVFDLWFQDLLSGQYVSIRHIDNWLQILLGGQPEACGMVGRCSIQFVVEGDGGVYPCDFYVLDELRLGTVGENSFAEMAQSAAARQFLQCSTPVPPECARCRWYVLCRNGCRRDRLTGADGLPGRSCYCDALQRFFRERAGRLQQAAAILARWR